MHSRNLLSVGVIRSCCEFSAYTAYSNHSQEKLDLDFGVTFHFTRGGSECKENLDVGSQEDSRTENHRKDDNRQSSEGNRTSQRAHPQRKLPKYDI